MASLTDQFNNGDHDAAIQAAVKRIDEKPTDPKRYSVLATMLIGIHAYDEASQLIVKALGLFPGDDELTYDAGLLAFSRAIRRWLLSTSRSLQTPKRGASSRTRSTCWR
ncbi:hypothetical protein [Lacticaseibacillus camelliae]|uniref:hypothetical protein n=1 Tax=Lacticaseibacillus camelliae TaxID=381742 RepID=UPI000A63801F|nr:hypothetical protein [Lacticaseibacillus camelliae]